MQIFNQANATFTSCKKLDNNYLKSFDEKYNIKNRTISDCKEYFQEYETKYPNEYYDIFEKNTINNIKVKEYTISSPEVHRKPPKLFNTEEDE